MFDYLVIGKGLFGAAATRYLSNLSKNVAVIGPDEPADPSSHTGIFGAHYDQARIISQVINREPIWAAFSHQTFSQLPILEAALGDTIYSPVGCLYVAPGEDHNFSAADQLAKRYQADYQRLNAKSQPSHLPMLCFPENCQMLWERSPAGYLNPRKLLQGQLAVAHNNGAIFIREIVSELRDRLDHVEVRTKEGGTYTANKVLIATGAYSNCFNLIDRPLDLRLKIEFVIFGELPMSEVERLQGMPTLSYQIESPHLADIYLFPPVQYPNGKYYIKMGANTTADRYVESLDEINGWYQYGNSDEMQKEMREALCAIVPGLQVTAWHTSRCVITRTVHAKPYIDILKPGRIYTAIGGNGTGAQSSDGIGKVAADLLINNVWSSELDPNAFTLHFADEGLLWKNRELDRWQG